MSLRRLKLSMYEVVKPREEEEDIQKMNFEMRQKYCRKINTLRKRV
jgi:hypothetical protein